MNQVIYQQSHNHCRFEFIGKKPIRELEKYILT